MPTHKSCNYMKKGSSYKVKKATKKRTRNTCKYGKGPASKKCVEEGGRCYIKRVKKAVPAGLKAFAAAKKKAKEITDGSTGVRLYVASYKNQLYLGVRKHILMSVDTWAKNKMEPKLTKNKIAVFHAHARK